MDADLTVVNVPVEPRRLRPYGVYRSMTATSRSGPAKVECSRREPCSWRVGSFSTCPFSARSGYPTPAYPRFALVAQIPSAIPLQSHSKASSSPQAEADARLCQESPTGEDRQEPRAYKGVVSAFLGLFNSANPTPHSHHVGLGQ